jgi:hypothetical protein
MPLSTKLLEDVGLADLEGLVSSAVPEGRRVDFKDSLPGNSDGDKREFLYDVSSFANAAGGDLIFGIAEAQGVASKVSPIQGANPDQEILRLEAIARTGLDPRIPGLRMRAIPVGPGFVLLVRIPRSWASPHMVTHSGVSRFYSRNSAGKYPLDVRELRSLFLLSDSAEQRVRAFRSDRLARIAADDVAFRLGIRPKLVFHAVPLTVSAGGAPVDLATITSRPELLRPSSAYGFAFRHNLDGFASYSVAADRAHIDAYYQVFRDGAIEATDAYILEAGAAKKLIYTRHVEDWLIELATSALRTQQVLNVPPPLVLMISLLGVNGFTLGTNGETLRLHDHPIDRDALLLPEVLVDDPKANAAAILRPALDALWNAGGWPGSQNYTATGERTQRRC